MLLSLRVALAALVLGCFGTSGALCATSGTGGTSGTSGTSGTRAQPLLAEPIRPLANAAALDPGRVALGRILYKDLRLSRSGSHSCASCHQLTRGGADARPLPLPGTLGPAQAGRYNTPTIYNSMLNARQGWTGRYGGIDAVLEHVMPAAPGASGWQQAAARLAGDADMGAHFNRVYGEDVRADLVKDALGTYLQTLTTPSRFDRYLRGDRTALSDQERLGYAKFKAFGCVSCHQGINVGGNMYQRFGAMRPLAPDAAMAQDPGRFAVTGREADRNLFRVPSLRNVALTAPYFHNGSVATLDEAVEAMFKYQLGRRASPADRELVIRFLKALSGEALPPSGAQP